MGQLIVVAASTVDGFAAGNDGNVFQMPLDFGFDRYNLERMRQASTLLFGARTFGGARKYWPSVAIDAAAPQEEREIAALYDRLPKLVVSDHLAPADAAPWENSTQVIGRADAVSAVAELRATGAGTVLVFGSFTLWHALLNAELVDEIHLLIGPGSLGNGLRVFPADHAHRFELLAVEKLVDSQLVALCYRVVG